MSTAASLDDRELAISEETDALCGDGGDPQSMKHLRAAVLVLLLVLAQSAALFHFVDHLKPDADEGSSHACMFCLAAHNLDYPLPTPATVVDGPLLHLAPPVEEAWLARAARLSPPRARAPPAA